MNLYLIPETYFAGYIVEFLNILYILSIISAIYVIISKNPIISVLFLIGLFLSVSGYLILLGINFIGLSYLLVYVGAVSVLFIFILMLINVRTSELSTLTNNSIPLSIIISIFIIYNLYEIYYTNFLWELPSFFINKEDEIMFATSKVWDNNLAENPDITSIGNIMYTNYFIWLIIISLILLLAMVGAICLVIS